MFSLPAGKILNRAVSTTVSPTTATTTNTITAPAVTVTVTATPAIADQLAAGNPTTTSTPRVVDRHDVAIGAGVGVPLGLALAVALALLFKECRRGRRAQADTNNEKPWCPLELDGTSVQGPSHRQKELAGPGVYYS